MKTKLQKGTTGEKTGKVGTNGRQKVKFHVQAPAKKKVFVAGTFNDWDPAANRLRQNGNSTYAANIRLAPGRYEYKFVIDGEWLIDTENSDWILNDMGSLNSVIVVSDRHSAAATTRG